MLLYYKEFVFCSVKTLTKLDKTNTFLRKCTIYIIRKKRLDVLNNIITYDKEENVLKA